MDGRFSGFLFDRFRKDLQHPTFQFVEEGLHLKEEQVLVLQELIDPVLSGRYGLRLVLLREVFLLRKKYQMNSCPDRRCSKERMASLA